VTGNIKVKKWISLGIIATTLLLVPRRSSRKSDTELSHKKNAKPDSTSI